MLKSLSFPPQPLTDRSMLTAWYAKAKLSSALKSNAVPMFPGRVFHLQFFLTISSRILYTDLSSLKDVQMSKFHECFIFISIRFPMSFSPILKSLCRGGTLGSESRRRKAPVSQKAKGGLWKLKDFTKRKGTGNCAMDVSLVWRHLNF